MNQTTCKACGSPLVRSGSEGYVCGEPDCPEGVEPLSGCPDDPICRTCLCASEDDACLPLEREREEVLCRFVFAMQEELAANGGKGDRPGWLSMSPREALAEVQHHYVKLHAAVVEFDRWENCQEPRQLPWGQTDGIGDLLAMIREFAADVANMAMMVADRCGTLRDEAEERHAA